MTDLLIVGSGPIGATYARLVSERRPGTRILMVELGPRLTPAAGLNVRNIADPAAQATTHVGLVPVYDHIVDERGAQLVDAIRVIIAADDDDAVLVHCTAGKDRTGLVVAFALAAAGVVAGVLLAAALAPLVSTQLYGIRALDPATMITVPALLMAIAALACLVPARRAMTVDPVAALRN